MSNSLYYFKEIIDLELISNNSLLGLFFYAIEMNSRASSQMLYVDGNRKQGWFHLNDLGDCDEHCLIF